VTKRAQQGPIAPFRYGADVVGSVWCSAEMVDAVAARLRRIPLCQSVCGLNYDRPDTAPVFGNRTGRHKGVTCPHPGAIGWRNCRGTASFLLMIECWIFWQRTWAPIRMANATCSLVVPSGVRKT
jgi:hypothetical protein